MTFSLPSASLDLKVPIVGGGGDGWVRRPYSSRLQPHKLFCRVFQASKVKPEAGVERRGGVKTTDFDRIDEKRSPLTNKIQKTHPFLTL